MPRIGGGTKGALFVTGVAELDSKLRTLSKSVQGKILRGAATRAMQPVLSQAKATMPFESGYTRGRLRIKTGKPRRNGSRTVRVGIFGPAVHGRGGRRRNVPTARIIEFTRGKFILRKALAANRAKALGILTSELKSGVLSAVAASAATGGIL